MTDTDTRLQLAEERLDRIETRLNSLERAQPLPPRDDEAEDVRDLQARSVLWLETNPVLGGLVALAVLVLLLKIFS
ncbi:MAG TPA: hypothetical protein VED40_10850 [Azospirillaceae bacterium]|nr:hypothetical protein [Azospirillaceae bacterium]